MFNRPNVHLITEKIEKANLKGLKVSKSNNNPAANNGSNEGGSSTTLIELDAIIFCTGFDLENSVKSFPVVGRHGKVLGVEWGEAPSAYKNAVYPNFPNLFLINGPNTALAHSSRVL